MHKHKNIPNYIFGRHACESVLKMKKRQIARIYIDIDARNLPIDSEILLQYKHIVNKVSIRTLEKMCRQDDKHQGIIIECGALMQKYSIEQAIKHATQKDKSAFVLLDQINDPHNIGAIIRSAACFDVDAVFITEDNSPSINCTIVRVSAGASEIIPIYKIESAKKMINMLKDNGFFTIALDSNEEKNQNLRTVIQKESKILFVLGSETGMRPTVLSACDATIRIPSSNAMDSLNVSNAAAIVFYEYYTKFN